MYRVLVLVSYSKLEFMNFDFSRWKPYYAHRQAVLAIAWHVMNTAHVYQAGAMRPFRLSHLSPLTRTDYGLANSHPLEYTLVDYKFMRPLPFQLVFHWLLIQLAHR